MYESREREIIIKRYGRYTRTINAPKPEQNTTEKKGGKRTADLNTPKSRKNFGTSAHKALAIALNNQWHWYGHLCIAKEDVTAFDDVCKAIQTITDRLRKQRERTEEKNLAYLIVPDFNEQENVQKWFLHIWLMNVPETDKAFSKDLIAEKKITYHWKKYENQNGRSELYKIYSSGRVSNNQYQEQNAFQIFDIMKRTAPVIPKNKNLFYSSNNVVGDIIIARGAPSEIHELHKNPTGNGHVYSEWQTSKNIEENIKEASKYLYSEEDEIARYGEWTEEDLKPPEPLERQKETFFSYDNYSYEGEYIPPADDNYYCTEPPEDFDYNELNEIYENEVYDFD